MSDQIAVARNAIGHVLSKLEIGGVVCIDDFYALSSVDNSAAVAIGRFAEAISLGKSQECGVLLGEPSLFSGPDEIWKRRLLRKWRELGETERLGVLDNLLQILGFDARVRRDRESASLLRDLIPESVTLEEVPPAKWESERDAILEGFGAGVALLCLFDHDLTHDPDYTGRDGIILLEQAVHTEGDHRLICGLLTHTVQVGDEIKKANDLATQHGLSREEFLVLSKDRLEDPRRFAHGVKMMSLSYVRDLLAVKVSQLTDQAGKDARDKLMELDIYDFDYMVLRSSAEEGVWEAETLFRLFDIFRRTAFRREAFKPENWNELNHKIAQIRAVRRAITIPDSSEFPPDQRWQTRRTELYEDGDLINKAHLPLELGDIFEIGQKKLILVAQPCDLIVRSNGTRSLTNLTLLKVTGTGRDINSFPLEYFDDATGSREYAKFRSSCHVSADILDLAVFSDDGSCEFDPSSSPPALLQTPWIRRFERIRDSLTRHQCRLDDLSQILTELQLDSESRSYLKKSFLAQISRSDLSIPFDYGQGTLEFGIRRIGRYRPPGSERLLRHYVVFLSRDAGAHDYTPPEHGFWECPRIINADFVGAQQSSRFHRASCRLADRIKAENRICFESREHAIAYERDPCSICNP